MAKATKCVCCNTSSEVATKQQIVKKVDCITEYPGFHFDCPEVDDLEADFYEHLVANRPPLDKLISMCDFV